MQKCKLFLYIERVEKCLLFEPPLRNREQCDADNTRGERAITRLRDSAHLLNTGLIDCTRTVMLTRADVVGMYLDALLCTWNDKVRYEYARVKLPFGCLSVALLWRDHLLRM